MRVRSTIFALAVATLLGSCGRDTDPVRTRPGGTSRLDGGGMLGSGGRADSTQTATSDSTVSTADSETGMPGSGGK